MKEFFNTVRPMFRGRKLSASQVSGMERIVKYARANKFTRAHLAYILATCFHETGQRMNPVREGFARSNAGAIRAVTNLYNRGDISVNYALPDKDGFSWYGRGDVQLTWKENYVRQAKKLGIPLDKNPDLMLDPKVSARVLCEGMRDGDFRKGRDLSMIPIAPTLDDFKAARDIINGDVKKNGGIIAQYAAIFFNALETEYKKQIKSVKSEEKEHSLWCSLMDFVGIGGHSDTGD